MVSLFFINILIWACIQCDIPLTDRLLLHDHLSITATCIREFIYVRVCVCLCLYIIHREMVNQRGQTKQNKKNVRHVYFLKKQMDFH